MDEERGGLQKDLKGWHQERGTQGSPPTASRFGVAPPLFCILWPEDIPLFWATTKVTHAWHIWPG